MLASDNCNCNYPDVSCAMATDLKGHAWAVLLTAHAELTGRIGAALTAAGLPGLDWYDVLWELEKAGGRLRMHDLARRVVLSRSNLSRLADRLEDAGLVAREDSAEDRRGYDLALTRAGRAMRKKMWGVYEAAIEREFSRHVTVDEARAIGEALGRAVKAAREN
jgi:DNA-binding MarR family transcriptional regulator